MSGVGMDGHDIAIKSHKRSRRDKSSERCNTPAFMVHRFRVRDEQRDASPRLFTVFTYRSSDHPSIAATAHSVWQTSAAISLNSALI